MIWLMAKSHIMTSKKPRSGARNFMPRETKMIRMVPRVTTVNSARKISNGKVGKSVTTELKSASINGPPGHLVFQTGGGTIRNEMRGCKSNPFDAGTPELWSWRSVFNPHAIPFQRRQLICLGRFGEGVTGQVQA